MLFEGQKRHREWPDLKLLWYEKIFRWAKVIARPCGIFCFGMREVLVWGADAGAVQFHWLCFAGAHPVGTAGPGHGRSGCVSWPRAQQQPHRPHSNGQLIFRKENPVLLSFVSRSAQALFMRSASFVRQSFRVSVKLFSLPSCFKSLITNVSVVLESS